MARRVVSWIVYRATRMAFPILVSLLLIGSWFVVTRTRSEKWVSVTGEDDSLMQRYQEALKGGKGMVEEGDKAIFLIKEDELLTDQRKDIGKTLKQLMVKGETGELDTTHSQSKQTQTPSLTITTTKTTTASPSGSSVIASGLNVSRPTHRTQSNSPLSIPSELRQYLPVKLRHNTCRINYYDRLIPYCPFCSRFDMSTVSIYVDAFDSLSSVDRDTIGGYMRDGDSCALPKGAKCSFTQDRKDSDAILKIVQGLNTTAPPRYCFPQVILLFSLADLPNQIDMGLSMYAEAHVNYNMHSEMEYVEMCRHMPHLLELKTRPPQSASERNGVAMFISNCNKKYNDRLIYLIKLMKHVRIDSFGRCLYNMRDKTGIFRPPSKKPDNWEEEFVKTASKYKMVIAFEHILEPHLISEKVFLILRAGAIPVYRGAPDIDLQIPGNKSVIDVAEYDSIEALGKYLNRVLSEPDLFSQHTQWNRKTLDELNNKHCGVKMKSEQSGPDVLSCQMCNQAYSLKLASYQGGQRACNCFNQPPPMY